MRISPKTSYQTSSLHVMLGRPTSLLDCYMLLSGGLGGLHFPLELFKEENPY